MAPRGRVHGGTQHVLVNQRGAFVRVPGDCGETERERETGGYDLTTCCFGASFETRDRNSVIARRHEDMSMVGHTTFWSINAGPLSGLQVTAGGEGSSALLPGWRNNNPEKQTNRKENTNRKNRKVKGLGNCRETHWVQDVHVAGLAALAAWIAWLR